MPESPADTPGHLAAAGECVSPGLGGAVGGLAAPGVVTGGPFYPRTLAGRPRVAGRGSRATAGHAQGGMRHRGAAAEVLQSASDAFSTPYAKTSPSKGEIPPRGTR